MNTFPNITTSTEIQRNYKKVAQRARVLGDALIVMSNSKPDLVVMNYDLYVQNFQKDKVQTVGFPSANDELLSLVGSMSNEEVVKLNKDIDEMNEVIYPEDWK